jgi:RimJ/RimL family protein N-acetyltransferase
MALGSKLSARNYTNEDRAACLALFDSNVPDFFAASERREYSNFLDDLPCPYLVLCSPGDGVIAAGGYYVTEEANQGALAWGLVNRACQRRGVGTELLQLRLARLRASGVDTVRVRTSPRSQRFFEHCGFRLVQVVPQGFPTSDLVELHLALHAA